MENRNTQNWFKLLAIGKNEARISKKVA